MELVRNDTNRLLLNEDLLVIYTKKAMKIVYNTHHERNNKSGFLICIIRFIWQSKWKQKNVLLHFFTMLYKI